MSRSRARRGQGEEGASLVLAIAFMLVFSLILTAVLQFSATSFRTANVVNDRNRASYAANAAVDTLVQRLRRDPSMNAGRDGQACDSATFTSDGTTATPSATATCTPQSPSGAAIPVTDGPANAILTEQNLHNYNECSSHCGDVTISNGGPLRTNANVFVNGAISVTGGATLNAHDGAIAATGSCDPSPAKLPDFDAVRTYCNATNNPTSQSYAPQFGDGADPSGYTSRFDELLKGNGSFKNNPDPIPKCDNTNTITVFKPNSVFTNVHRLANAGCSSNVLYFPAGVYYFDFKSLNSTCGSDCIWNIANTTVVGGTPTSWYPNANALPTANGDEPTACTPGGNGAGVQFIFGGESQINLGTGARLELCPLNALGAQAASPRDRIALYGAHEDPPNYQPILTLRPSAATGCGGAFTPTASPNLLGPDADTSPLNGQAASATGGSGTGQNPPPACESFTDFSWGSNGQAGVKVPSGYVLTSVMVHVAHSETGTPAVTAKIDVSNCCLDNGPGPPPSCTANFLPYNPTVAAPLKDESVLCDLQGTTKSNGQGVGQDIARSITVTWNVAYDKSATGTAKLDGLELDLHLDPILNRERDCVVNDRLCPLLSAPSSTVAIGGTVYAPLAYMDVGLGGQSNTVFNWGVIVRSLNASTTPGDTKNRFRLGDGTGRTVEVVGKTDDGRGRVRALARIVDSFNANPHGFVAAIRQWSTAK